MAEITAAAVMGLRDKTGLPMMECKKALQECGGDEARAMEWLRKQGQKTQALRADRETSTGRLAVHADPARGVGAMIELKCESAPVAGSPDFKSLAEDMAMPRSPGRTKLSPDSLRRTRRWAPGAADDTAQVPPRRQFSIRFTSSPAALTSCPTDCLSSLTNGCSRRTHWL